MLNDALPVVSAAAAPRTAQSGPHELARFIAELDGRELSCSLLARARLVVADLIGVIAAGAREPEMRRLTARLTLAAGAGSSAVIGHDAWAPAEVAALLHGTAGTFLELDEGNRFSRGHPGIHVLPVALAVAQSERASGAQLLTAFIAGYEVAARIGAASQIRPSFHPHGTWGTVGAAVAVRKLLGGSAADFERTISIASTLGLATSVNTMREGATVRNAFAGASGKTAMLVEALVGAGFTGEADGLASVYGGVVATSFDWARMLEDLGRRWEIERNYFKVHACCRFNHAALDALADALCGLPGPPTPVEVESMDVHTYSLATQLANPSPANPLAAKYSLPFALATAVVHGSTGVQAFSQQAVDNPEVLRLAQKVRVYEDHEMTKLLPQLRQARVELRLTSGERRRGFVRTNRGDSQDPIGEAQLEHKFMSLTAGTWTPVEASCLWRRISALERVADVSTLFQGLAQET